MFYAEHRPCASNNAASVPGKICHDLSTSGSPSTHFCVWMAGQSRQKRRRRADNRVYRQTVKRAVLLPWSARALR
jgi:hypothetical protein